MIAERLLYNALLPAASLAARAAAPWNEKIREGLSGRRGWRERFGAAERLFATPDRRFWFHVSSVGEFEQAKPVMALLAERIGEPIDIALTFYSPSGMNYYRRFDRSKRIAAVKFVDYLPIDSPANVRAALEAIRPCMMVYVKFDLWPNLIVEAARRDIPQVLISGTLSPGSKRLSLLARRFYAELYSMLAGVAAISDEDAERFRRGLRSDRGEVEIVTAGDTRFDQVCRRIDSSTVKLPAPLLGRKSGTVVAGSTWPKDEEVVIPGFRMLRESHPGFTLTIAPHEPTPERLAEISGALEREGLPFRLLSRIADDTKVDEPVVVADGVGYLAELYRSGTLAYVGGSFTTGVHNVMEPAVLGLPLFFGPRIHNSYEARKLVELGVGAVVRSAEEFARGASALLDDRSDIEKRGAAGSAFIRNHCGAARHCVDLMLRHFERRKARRG